MQMPFGPNPIAEARSEASARAVFSYPGQLLSFESQLKLREFYEYVESCRGILGEIRADLSLFEANSEDLRILRKASERLEKFCLEADSWGFSALYHIGLSLQMLLLNTGRIQDSVFWSSLDHALEMLSALLDQCESEFRWRLATAEMLDSLEQLSHN